VKNLKTLSNAHHVGKYSANIAGEIELARYAGGVLKPRTPEDGIRRTYGQNG